MNRESVLTLLGRVQRGELAPDSAVDALTNLPYEELGFAKIDHHRELRRGMPEVVYAEGKTVEQVALVLEAISGRGSNALATRVRPEHGPALVERLPLLHWDPISRTARLTPQPIAVRGRGPVAVVTAGTSDIPIAEEAAITAEFFGNSVERVYDVGVAGLHRVLAKREVLTRAAVVIVVAGMEGALASVVGGLVAKPVIAVPTSIGYGASFGGVAALLTMLNSCASGVTVVNIDNGFGAAFAASLINGVNDAAVAATATTTSAP